METHLDAIPNYLVSEIIDREKYYYKNFRKVLNKSLTLEAVMGCSELQARIISAILQYLYKNVNTRHFDVLLGEVEVHLSANNNFSIDVAVFDRHLPKNRNKNGYLSVAPLYAFEVDINIEQDQEEEGQKKKHKDDFSYMLKKSTRLIASGTQKVI